MVVKVFVDVLSQPCRSVMLFLKNSKIPHEFVYVELLKDEHKKPEFQAINPMMQVPAMKDGDFCLSESVAILRYLTMKYPNDYPDNWYPADIEKRAKVDEYMAFQHQGIRHPLEELAYEEAWPYPVMLNKPIDEEAVKKYHEHTKGKLDIFAKTWLGKKPFLLGAEVSFADVMAVNELVQSTISRDPVTDSNDTLKAYMERVRDALNPVFDELSADVYKWRDEFIAKNKK
ncbi:glutathione S-transferase theta-1-like [Diadema antillarum]|uniref:glutathione S-transferase theta-1-like n=1 Tax=Diadema antillarum TaxID=105358 RepID=UPI003A8946F3